VIPVWKLKRELARIGQQLRIPISFTWAIVGKYLYERNKHRHVRLSAGKIACHPDIAIVLIYQPIGLQASLFETCRHLVSHGISPFIVSNAPLQEHDRNRLLERSYLIMERPNFGYDFGGYRDGILHLLDSGIFPSNLLVMNDSIWFPTLDKTDLIATIRNQDNDLFGPVFNDRLKNKKLSHLQSYMFNFKHRVLYDPAFRRYWERLVVSGNKQLVVRLCEMRMTRKLQDLGFSLGYIWTAEDGIKAMKMLHASQLSAALDYIGSTQPKIAARITSLRQLRMGEAEILDTVTGSYSTAPYLLKLPAWLLIDMLGLPFLKKDRSYPYRKQRIDFLQTPPKLQINSIIQAEIIRWDQI